MNVRAECPKCRTVKIVVLPAMCPSCGEVMRPIALRKGPSGKPSIRHKRDRRKDSRKRSSK